MQMPIFAVSPGLGSANNAAVIRAPSALPRLMRGRLGPQRQGRYRCKYQQSTKPLQGAQGFAEHPKRDRGSHHGYKRKQQRRKTRTRPLQNDTVEKKRDRVEQ